MQLSEARGKLVIIGGGEDKEGECEILKKFVQLAKGPKANIVVLTTATNLPGEVGEEYLRVFKRLGVDEVQVVDVSSREDARKEESLRAIKEATGLFFTGGDQLLVTSLMGGTEMQKIIHQRYEKGLVIGGTSAGAAMMSNSMILTGDPEQNPRLGRVEIGPGMDLIVGAMIDTHFSQRGRYGRLLTAVAHYPQDLGLGIDEDTAMIVNKQTFEVIGSGAVIVIDGGTMTHTNLPYIEKGKGVAMFGVNVHVLPAGYKFDLGERAPIIEDESEKNRGSESDGKKNSNSGRSKPKKSGRK